MDSLESKPIPGSEGAVNPFFSPDGQWLGFFAGGMLKKISVSGGSAVTLGDALQPSGAGWGTQAMIAFVPTFNGGIQQLPDTGGAPQPLTRFDKGELTQRWPEPLPGGKAVIFSAGKTVFNSNDANLVVQSLGKGEWRNAIQGGMQPRYAPSGHLVYAQGGSLMAVDVTTEPGFAAGKPRMLFEGPYQPPQSQSPTTISRPMASGS
jgi:hypothetical protein